MSSKSLNLKEHNLKHTASVSWEFIFMLIALVVSELLYFLSSVCEDTLVPGSASKTTDNVFMFLLSLYFARSTWMYHSTSYLADLVFIPLFTFNFNGFFFTFARSSNHSPLSIFLSAALPTLLMQFLLGFTLLARQKSSSSSKLLPVFKILAPLLQILSESTMKTVYQIF